LGKSLIKHKTRSSPNTNPCGTLDKTEHRSLSDMAKFPGKMRHSNGISLARNSTAFFSCLNKQLCHKPKFNTLNGRIGRDLSLAIKVYKIMQH